MIQDFRYFWALQGSFGSTTNVISGAAKFGTVSTDFDGDSKMDLATANMSTCDVSIFLGAGNGTSSSPISYTVPSAPNAICLADFNLNGKPDFATANAGNDNMSVFKNNGNGIFAPQVLYSTGTTGSIPSAIVSSNFNNDGKTDLAVSNSFAAIISVRLGTGGGALAIKCSLRLLRG